MQKYFSKFLLVVLAFAVISCAKKGTLTGGDKDTLAPVLDVSFPKNFSTNFTSKEIKLNFDEYIKIKDLSKQLIISPPMKNQPDILPTGATKSLTIRIKDTLLPNTTYSFNFGNSIQDNNEGNPLQQFKYVFSTGNYIDSLKVSASVKDAIAKKDPNFVSIMLYEVNDKYTDSVVFKEVPRYITNTLDSLKVVKLENLKQGKYRLIALKDGNSNNKYEPKTDQIGFKKQFITIPNDSLFELQLFKEDVAFKAISLNQTSGSKMTLGYEGNPKNVKLSIKKGSEELPYVITKIPKKDSLNVWFRAIKGDSLNIVVSKEKFNKTYSLKIKDQKKDTLSFSPEKTGVLHFRDRFAINSATPLVKFDESKMKLINKDSVDVKFTTEYDSYNNQLKFNFEKAPLEKYELQILPGAMTDLYEKSNDSLKYKFTTNNTSDYGNLRVALENVKRFPVLVELTDDKGVVIASVYSEKETRINFDLLEPRKFTLRLIYDDNKDKEWTPGNFLEQRQSEEVIYFPKEIDVRANWDVEQPFDVRLTP